MFALMLDCEFLFDPPEELPNVLFPPETVCCIHIALQTFVHLPIIHVIRWGSRVPIAIIYHMLRCILQFIICLHFCEGLILQCTIITTVLSSMVAALSSNCIRRWSIPIWWSIWFLISDLMTWNHASVVAITVWNIWVVVVAHHYLVPRQTALFVCIVLEPCHGMLSG